MGPRGRSCSCLVKRRACAASGAPLKAPRQTKTMRSLFHHLLQTGTLLHLFWVPTKLMHADPISKIQDGSRESPCQGSHQVTVLCAGGVQCKIQNLYQMCKGSGGIVYAFPHDSVPGVKKRSCIVSRSKKTTEVGL